ncbi:MAG: isocitrate/isopropylmalate family dehydrogenase [Halioglobus sp.]
MPRLCIIPGDGIGREVIPAAAAVLQAVLPELQTETAEAGWDCFLQHGTSLPDATLQAVKRCGAGLFGAVSSPSHKVDSYRSAILELRQKLGLYANIRPVRSWPCISPRGDFDKDVDMVIVRENSEGIYSGIERSDGETAVAERIITRSASRRIAKRSVELARLLGRERLTIVHKANVLPLSDGLFRDSVRAVLEDSHYPLSVDELLVDVAALKLHSEPHKFDMIVTTNLFGDILSDAAAYWGGGLGMAPSLNWGENIAVAEPVHGSAPDIAGKGLSNPLAAILSGALLARLVWGEDKAAARIESAVFDTLSSNLELSGGTTAITMAVLERL